MARIPYPDDSNPEVAQLRAQIVAERGKLLNLYRMLLNSPPVAQGWLNFLTAIRQKCLISGRLRELAILRIAVINQADYEFVSHVPFALKEGLTQQQIDAVSNWEASSLYSDQERAVLGYTDSMTRDVHVPEAIFEPIRRLFSTREVTELTATIAAYNLVSRFLEALQVDPEPEEQK
jgi:AhpD family alkylhydroperoxidase